MSKTDETVEMNFARIERVPLREPVSLRYGDEEDYILFQIADIRDWGMGDRERYLTAQSVVERWKSLQKTGKGSKSLTTDQGRKIIGIYRILGKNMATETQIEEWDRLPGEAQELIITKYGEIMKDRQAEDERTGKV